MRVTFGFPYCFILCSVIFLQNFCYFCCCFWELLSMAKEYSINIGFFPMLFFHMNFTVYNYLCTFIPYLWYIVDINCLLCNVLDVSFIIYQMKRGNANQSNMSWICCALLEIQSHSVGRMAVWNFKRLLLPLSLSLITFIYLKELS